MEKWKIIVIPYILVVASLIALRLEAISGNYGAFLPTFVVFWSSFFSSILLTVALLLRWVTLHPPASDVPVVFCGFCGAQNSRISNYCLRCGQKLEK